MIRREIVKVSKVKPYPKNNRKHPPEQISALARQIESHGFDQPIVVDETMVILKGHARLKAIKKLGWKEVEVIVNDGLSDYQKKAVRIADNQLSLLAAWDDVNLVAEMKDLQLADFDLDLTGFDVWPTSEGSSSGEGGDGPEGLDPNYTKNIKSPIYTPKGEKPPVSSLVDTTKMQQLLEHIDRAEIPEEEKEFLRFAAYRHNAFHYERIAEFYAHAAQPLQALMEESALVIIDFGKAIENGFVTLSQELAAAYVENPHEKAVRGQSDNRNVPSIIGATGFDHFERLVDILETLTPSFDRAKLRIDTAEMIEAHKGDKEIPKGNVASTLLDQWYSSLKKGAPDYSVYSSPYYLADIWCCWVTYSRGGIKALFESQSLGDRSLASVIDQEGTIVDAGCGIAFTTAALKQGFPSARVIGTNFPNSWQFKLGTRLGEQYGFEMLPNPLSVGKVELFVASEYFEHITHPIAHLRAVVAKCAPSYFVIANGFNGTSIGHFNEYAYNGGKISNREMSKVFWKELRLLDYEKMESKIWNGRPSIWRRK